jgi:four helix bundle protein
MRVRTKSLPLRITRLVNALPRGMVAREIGKQLLRAGTSVGANYRAACRARSKAEFRAKLSIVEEEADESAFWLELLAEADIVPMRRLEELLGEADQLLAMTVASIRTSRKGRQ